VFDTDVQLGDVQGPRAGQTFIANPTTDKYHDTGTYSIPSGFCNKADGVRCDFHNAKNLTLGGYTYYGDVTLSDAIAVSSDAFFYRIGAEMFLAGAGQPILQDELKLFGFGEKSGIDLPYEYKGIVPDAAIKKKLAEQGAISKGEGKGFFVGDSVQMAIGQGLNAVTPLQLVNAYSTYANGGFLLRPLIVRAIFAPSVPDSTKPGYADVLRGTIVKDYRPELRRQLDMIPDKVGPIYDGLHRVINTPIVNGHTPTAFKVFQGYDIAPTLSGKTGTAQGRDNLPENDSSVFAAFESDRPGDGYTVVAYLEKSGYGKQAAAPLVRCMFRALRGQEPTDPVDLADELDVRSVVAAPINLLSNPDCVKGVDEITTGER
jgi:penicillin-binding protein 2